MKKVIFRADASNRTGAGHVMRSVALAQHLTNTGIEVLFLSASSDDPIRQYLKNQKFKVRFLDLNFADCGTPKDLEITLPVLGKDADWVVLDNDYFDYDYQSAIRRSGAALLLIDDRNKRRFDADLLVNHALDAEHLNYHDSSAKRILLGSSYAMIRQELIPRTQRLPKGTQHLLVTLGGSIQSDVGGKIIRAIQSIKHHSFEVKILGGFSEPTQQAQSSSNSRIQWCPATLDVAPLYAWADLAVCAGGGTCWELCFFGIAGIVGALAPQQMRVVDTLKRHEIFTSVGFYSEASEAAIAKALANLVQDASQLEARRKRAMRLVDGKGVRRIMKSMQSLTTNQAKARGIS